MRNFSLILLLATALAGIAQVQPGDSIIENDSVFTVRLDNVEVKASRSVQRLSKGGLITDVKGTALGELGTCRDVLVQLQGVKENEGKIEITGRGTPQIYINGRKLVNSSELDRISSKDVRSVEVVFNPGAKYGAETRCVILIKTVGKPGDALSGSIQASGRQAHSFSQSDNLFLNYRKDGLDLFGAFNYDYSRRYQKQRNETAILTDAADYLVRSDIRIYPKGSAYSTNIGANWQINENNYVGIKYEYSATPNSRSRWSTHETVTRNNDRENEIIYDTNWERNSLPVHLVNQYYQGKVRNLALSINNDYYYGSQRNNQSVYEVDLSGGDRASLSVNRIKSEMFASKGVAEYSFGNNTLEFGYEITATDRHDIFKNEMSGLPDADDRIKETTGAGFVAVNIPIKRVELYAGLRYEHTSSDYYQNDAYVSAQSRKYSRFYPNIDFTFPIKSAKFTLSYESKTKRPLYSQLSSSIQYDDRFTYETGNPLLKSERIHTISLAGIYKWVFFSTSYTYDKDAIISVIPPYSPGEPQNLMTYENFDHLSTYNVVLSLSPRISIWSPRLRFNLLGQRFSMETVDGIKNRNTPILFVNFFNSLSLGHGFYVNGDISGHTRGDMDVVTMKPSWQLNIGLSKNYNGWFFQLQATDLFKTARNSMITHGYQMTLDKWNYSDTQAVRIILRYSFNTTASKYKGKGAGVSERARLL